MFTEAERRLVKISSVKQVMCYSFYITEGYMYRSCRAKKSPYNKSSYSEKENLFTAFAEAETLSKDFQFETSEVLLYNFILQKAKCTGVSGRREVFIQLEVFKQGGGECLYTVFGGREALKTDLQLNTSHILQLFRLRKITCQHNAAEAVTQ